VTGAHLSRGSRIEVEDCFRTSDESFNLNKIELCNKKRNHIVERASFKNEYDAAWCCLNNLLDPCMFFLHLKLRQSKMFRSEQEVGGSLSVGEELFTGMI